MSARNMVRNLRDSGELAELPRPPAWRSAVLLFLAALFAGAVLYFGAVYGAPWLMKAIEKKPPPVHYAKPADSSQH